LESFYGNDGLHPVAGGPHDRPLPHALCLQTLVIFPSHTYGLARMNAPCPRPSRKRANYNTAMIGNGTWAMRTKKYWPQSRGFDYFYGNLVGEVDYSARSGAASWIGSRNGNSSRKAAITPT